MYFPRIAPVQILVIINERIIKCSLHIWQIGTRLFCNINFAVSQSLDVINL